MSMLFIAISFSFMSLFQDHVACWNFILTGPHSKLINELISPANGVLVC